MFQNNRGINFKNMKSGSNHTQSMNQDSTFASFKNSPNPYSKKKGGNKSEKENGGGSAFTKVKNNSGVKGLLNVQPKSNKNIFDSNISSA